MRDRIRVNIEGQRFGRWVAGKPTYLDGRPAWNVVCDCGSQGVVVTGSLRRGLSRSCGCLKKRVEPPAESGMGECLRLLAIGVLSIDELGRIWRIKTLLPGGVWSPVIPRRAENSDKRGYFVVTVGVGHGRTMMVLAHRLVWTYKRGPIPEGLQINHKDMNKTNNHPDNLEVVTNLENARHAMQNRTAIRRNKTWRGTPTTSDQQILEIREKYAAGTSLADLSKEYGRTPNYIRDLCKGGDGTPKTVRIS